MTFDTRQIEQIAPDQLNPWAHNARRHSKKQVRQIAESIRAFGFTNPVLVDAENTILAGHGRVEAAKLIGRAEVPCIRLENMTREQKRAYVLSDNKLAQNAGWDEDLLAEELKGLMSSDLGFDIGVAGFSIAELDILVDALPLSAPVVDEDPAAAPNSVGEQKPLEPLQGLSPNLLDVERNRDVVDWNSTLDMTDLRMDLFRKD